MITGSLLLFEIAKCEPTFDRFDEVHALVLHVRHQLVGDQHMYTLRPQEQYRVQAVGWQTQSAKQLVCERGARQIVQVSDSPERAVAFQREVEGELRRWRLGVQRVEQPDAVRHPADLDEILAGQTQDVRGGEAREGRLERVEATRAQPCGCLRRVRIRRQLGETRRALRDFNSHSSRSDDR